MVKKKSQAKTPTQTEIDNAFQLASHLNVIADHYWSQLSHPQPPEQIESIKNDLFARIPELTHTLTPTLESVIRDPVTLVEMGGRSFRTAHGAALEFGGSVVRYMYGHCDPVTKRVPRHSEWSMDRLDKLIEVERNRGIQKLKTLDRINECHKYRLELNAVANVAILDGHKIELNEKQTEALSLLIAKRGGYVSLSAAKIRTRDIDPWPEQLKQLIESYTGAGTRLVIEKVELA